MEDRRGAGLAARLKAAIERRIEAERAAVEQARRRTERLSRERERLLGDLAAFGRAVGHFRVLERPGELVLSFGDSKLRFSSRGPADLVELEGAGLAGDQRLRFEERLSRWVWSRPRRAGAAREKLLFDEGLEELVRVALGVGPTESEALPTATDRPGGGQ